VSLRALRALAAVALSMATACSPAAVGAPSALDDAGVDGAVPPAVVLSCQNYAYAYCNFLNGCSSTFLVTRWGTQAACEAALNTTCTYANLAPSSLQSPATTDDCTSKLTPDSWQCSDFLYSQNRPPACANQASGSKANGASCAINQQCQSSYCATPIGHACGTCQPLPSAGSSCATYECPTGLQCTSSTCVALALSGAACSTSQPCGEGLTCTAGSCEPGATMSGAPCTVGGPGCAEVDGLVCNAASSTCQTLMVPAVGQPCGVVGDQATVCPAAVCLRGVCVANRQVGESCELGGSVPCVTSARCILPGDGGTTGTCQINGSTSCE
jgi:hypothetical protein